MQTTKKKLTLTEIFIMTLYLQHLTQRLLNVCETLRPGWLYHYRQQGGAVSLRWLLGDRSTLETVVNYW